MGLVKHGPMPGEDEPLHAYITGPTLDSVTKAGEKVRKKNDIKLSCCYN